MFDVPNAKRVKRSDLFRYGSDSEDAEIEIANDLHITAIPSVESDTGDLRGTVAPNYGFEYEIINPVDDDTAKILTTSADEERDTFLFNLFRPKTKINPLKGEGDYTNHKETSSGKFEITLRSSSPVEEQEGRFVQPIRPLHQFFTSALPERELDKLKEQYRSIALSGEQIESRSRSTKWPGSDLPWRVIHIPKSKLIDRTGHNQSSSTEIRSISTIRRKKPSKKRRILLRKHIVARNVLKAATERDLQAQQEKRTKKNRNKKLKRKEKEKKKKLEGALQSGTEQGIAIETGTKSLETGS